MNIENLERWLAGENPQIILPEQYEEAFFKELRNRGFKNKGEPLPVEGLSGTYYLNTLEDEMGNQVFVKSGGRGPTMVDFYVPKHPSLPSQK